MKPETDKYDFLRVITGSSIGMFFIDLLQNLFVTCITMVVTIWLGFHLQRWLKNKYKE